MIEAEPIAQQSLEVRQQARVIDQIAQERLLPGQETVDARILAVVAGYAIRVPVNGCIQMSQFSGRQHILDDQEALQVEQVSVKFSHGVQAFRREGKA